MHIRHRLFAAFVLASSLAHSADSLAWPPGGVLVAPVPNRGQTEPRLLLGREASVLAYWSDGRWLDRSDLYAQLLTRYGTIAPGWPDTGLMVARARDNQRSGAGLAHPDGSFLVGINDDRNFGVGGTRLDTYLTRIQPDGRIDPAWPRHGFRTIDRPDDDGPARMVWVAPDTLVIASAYQYPSVVGWYLVPLLQRVAITPSGPELPWGAAGILYPLRPVGLWSTLEIVADEAGGAYVLFDEVDANTNGDPADFHLMRVGRDGQPAPSWEGGPRPVCVAPGKQEFGALCADGTGGVYVAWADARDGAGLPWPDYNDHMDIRLLRFTPQGLPYPGWPAEGLLVSDAPGMQFHPYVVPDGTGGVYVSFDDVAIQLTRVQGDGTFAPGWSRNGIPVSTRNIYMSHSRMVLDGIGGVYVLFEDSSNLALDLQHVLPWGDVDPAWPSDGYEVSLIYRGDIISDGEGGCYVASGRLQDPTNFLSEAIFVARFAMDGPVPVKLAEATVEVETDRVRLTWHGVEGAGPDLTVQRRPDGIESWTSLGAPVVRGSDLVEYEDISVEPGVRYAYRLTRGAEILSAEQWVTVPASARFALRGARPNPALARELAVELSLAGGGGARLEVLDLAGRREYARDLGRLEPGRHTLPLAEARLAPGVHWLRLTEGPRVAQTRVVVVR